MVKTVNFTNVKTMDFCGNEFSCSCGKNHSTNVKKIYLGHNALSTVIPTLKSVMPMGHIQLITDSDCMNKHVDDFVKKLASQGYKATINSFDSNALPDVKDIEKLFDVPENTRLVISFGNERITDLAKYYCYKSSKRLLAIITEPSSDTYLVPQSLLYNEGLLHHFISLTPEVLVCDLNILGQASRSAIAAGFGMIVSKYNAITDYEFLKILKGYEGCNNLLQMLKQSIEMCLNAAELIVAGDKQGIGVLTEALVRSSLCKSMLDNPNVFSGGEYNCAIAVEGMRRHAKVDSPKLGELSFILASYVSKVYEQFFSKGFNDLLLPADRVMHSSRIVKLFGADIIDVDKLMSTSTDFNNLSLYRYKVEEFREDFILKTHNASKYLNKAMVSFKRIYLDSGYWLNTALKESETKLALALGSYNSRKMTVLKYMTEIGCFDRYLG